jgi:hypothetical protein
MTLSRSRSARDSRSIVAQSDVSARRRRIVPQQDQPLGKPGVTAAAQDVHWIDPDDVRETTSVSTPAPTGP